eukprot:TRINITY_DN34_c0_g1_i1.p1 TRINITY_DN34_c0_g1~~TRINITY_DN34_c0_g1_i1.p1  ORF type:complete len:197 (-),score=68.04 TRINITY_DN34_c0_g1_i1:53-643(-)
MEWIKQSLQKLSQGVVTAREGKHLLDAGGECYAESLVAKAAAADAARSDRDILKKAQAAAAKCEAAAAQLRRCEKLTAEGGVSVASFEQFGSVADALNKRATVLKALQEQLDPLKVPELTEAEEDALLLLTAKGHIHEAESMIYKSLGVEGTTSEYAVPKQQAEGEGTASASAETKQLGESEAPQGTEAAAKTGGA